ncbi:MAG: MerR family transcriptional regulator [Acidimicrobiales bacterium]
MRLSLSELVAVTDVPASTVHHYRRVGLIPPPERVALNRFCYDERHIESLRLIRRLRQARGMSLEAIACALPGLLADPPGAPSDADQAPADVRDRIVAAATKAFRTQSYAEVTVGDVADRAKVAKGRVYRYFASKEDLFDAVVVRLLDETAASFAAAVEALGGPDGIANDPDRTAEVFAGLVAGAMPILLELGARAAKGHPSSGILARRVLRTLAEAAGSPLDPDDSLCAGLGVIDRAFAQVIAWAVTPDWEIPPGTGQRRKDGA